jgi:hypothetical protein
MPRIAGFDDDVQIVHIGELFRARSKRDWYINVWCRPLQDKKSTRISNLALLSRSKRINSSKRGEHSADRVIELPSGYQLFPAKLADFPDLSNFDSVRKAESRQNAFIYTEQKPRRTVKYVIPQLELARAIFLINSYLCRACLSSTTLQLEFDVQRPYFHKHVDIHVLKTSTFPLSAFDQSGTTMILAWLLTNSDAMNSFQSIYSHYMRDRQFKGIWESWCFSFDPPPMDNWTLHVRGRFSDDKSSYLVEEIIGIDIDTEMPVLVAFIHPDFVKKENKDGSVRHGSGSVDWRDQEEEYEIDDEESASDQNQTTVIESGASFVRFKRPCSVVKQERFTPSHKLIIDEESEREGGKQVSTDEPNQAGKLPSADLGGKQDLTDRDRYYAGRFISFDHMLKILKFVHGCTILHQDTLALPKVGRSQQQMLENGTPRVIKSVWLRHGGQQVVLLEVDTSDGVKMLSTKILFNADPAKWDEQYLQIRKGVVSKSLSWPNELLDTLYGEHGHRGINHPKHQGAEAGNIPRESLESWALRVLNNLGI